MSEMGWAKGPRRKTFRRSSPPPAPRPARDRQHVHRQQFVRGLLRGIGDAVSGLDPLALLAVAVLVVLGLLNLVAIGQQQLAIHQGAAVIAGCLLLAILNRSRVHSLRVISRVAYLLAVLLLLAVLVGGVQANGARRWLVVGSFVVQPSELAKLGLLLVLADVLGESFSRTRLWIALALASAPVAMTLLQPDLSTSLLLVMLTLAALLVARVPIRSLLPVAAAAVLLVPLGQHFLKPYQLSRFNAFLSHAHQNDPTGTGWSLLQAHIAIASGGLYGAAHQPLHQLMAQYLPARETDLAFASLVEEWGIVAGFLALLASAVLVWRLLASARRARTRGGVLVASGLAVLFGVEVVVNLAGNLGTLPLAGVPFPFLSYGGTTAAAHLAAIGLVISARRDVAVRSLWVPPIWAQKRPRVFRLLAAGISVQLAALSGVAWQIQTAEGASLRQMGRQQMSRCLRIEAPRGVIEDRHGVALTANHTVWEVHAVPALLAADPQATASLGTALGVGQAELSKTLAKAHGGLGVKLAEVPDTLAMQLAASPINATYLVPSPRRSYPYGPLVAPLLGFVGVATADDMKREIGLPLGSVVGRTGLELQYDTVLRGVDGYQCVYVDPLGSPVALAERMDPVPGADLLLSLDLGLQQKATEQLANRLKGSKADLGAAVVMDARNGDILAMASLPSYDNNVYGPPIDERGLRAAATAPGHPMLEHATQLASPPGSTFKLVTASAQVNFGVLAPDQVIPTGYTFGFGNVTFHGWGYLPAQNLPQAIAWSNDVYFYKVALALGPERIKEVGSLLGAGELSGIDLPGESGGLLGTPDIIARNGGTWYPGNSVILGIGQGYVTATPLQVARWSAAIATGRSVAPHLGLAYRTPAAIGSLTFPAPKPLPFAAQLGSVREGMRQAVTNGLDPEVKDLPVPAGAKTGTAEDPSTVSGEPDSWYVATAPYTNADVAGIVFARGGGQGYLSGMPLRNILDYYYKNRAAIEATPAVSGS
jgi:cell division protein FtsI/penicillin-binding protein 2/cell division protein FtsW (lipid II flippase)